MFSSYIQVSWLIKFIKVLTYNRDITVDKQLLRHSIQMWFVWICTKLITVNSWFICWIGWHIKCKMADRGPTLKYFLLIIKPYTYKLRDSWHRLSLQNFLYVCQSCCFFCTSNKFCTVICHCETAHVLR